MDKISISHFKATCLDVLARVKRTGQPILVTRHGVPVAEVVPPSMPEQTKSWLGSRSGSGKIVGDIIGPATDEAEWESLRP